jgi:hypothetical protein
MSTRKTVLSIVIAAVLVVIICSVVAIVGLAYFVRSHVSAVEASDRTAIEEITHTRQRFAGQAPLIERTSDKDEEDAFVVHHPSPEAPRAHLEALRAVAYNPHGGKMLRVSIPFWILRMAPSSARFNILDSADVDVGRARLTIDDLERHGPGLVLDTKNRRGSRVLVWLE